MKKFIHHHRFFVMATNKFINWNFKHGQIRRLLFHVLFYPIAYVRYMYFTYKGNNQNE